MKAIQKLNKFKNNARRITNLVFRGLSGAYERGGRSASPVTTGASDSVSEKHLNGDSSYHKDSIVLRHGLFLSLYSLIKKASGKLPWRSRTNNDSGLSSSSSNYILSGTRNYIKNFRRIRILGSASLFSLGLLLLATFVPLYNVTRTEDTEAAAGTAKDSSITFTATRSTASVDLTVTSEDGTFASSTSSNQAAFSLSTTNFTGYTLTIASNTNTSTLTNTNGGSLSSISEPIDESTFNTTAYNNKWGYRPNYYNSAANSNYLQSPTTTASTLDETSTANSTAKNYTIAIGARADYTNASGTYSSSNYKLMYVANPVAYSITYADNSGDSTVANIPAVQSSDSVTTTTINLTSSKPTRTGYSFKSWCLGTVSNNGTSCSGTEYNSGASFGIDRTTTNIVTLYATWSINSYTLSITNNGNASVNGAGTYQYGQTVTLTATPNTSTTCTSYSTPTWSKTSGEGTLNNASGTSVTFTMGAGNAAITVSSTASDIPQTITLSRSTGASGIKIGGTNYTASSVSLNCGSYSISGNYSSGYEFSSWSRSGSVTVSSTSNASTTMTVSGAGTLTLNAKQSCTSSLSGIMQNWTTPASSVCAGATGTMTDNRSGNKRYTVAKIGDLIWMTRNLDLPGGTTLSQSDSNLNGSTTSYTLRASSTSGFNDSTTGWVYNSGRTTCSDNSTGSCYSYYSYAAATAGTNPSSGAASSDICPYGWRLPTQAEYNTLVSSYNTGAKLVASPFYGVYTGIYNNGPFYNGGAVGYYWSSTASDIDAAYYLYFGSSIAGAEAGAKFYGIAVRCVFGPPTMQDATASSLAALMPNTGNTATLVDSRDGKEYSVAKLADGKYWMTSNLDLTGGITLTSSDSNVSSDYYLPASSSSPNFSSNTAATVYDSNSTNCSKGCYSYYSYLAATAGTGSSVSTIGYNASGSICPKGWRLPTATTSNANVQQNKNWKTGDFYALAKAYGANLESSYVDSSSSTGGKFYTNAGPRTTPNFLLSGGLDTSFYEVGSTGYYWSSTASSSTGAYALFFYSGRVHSAYISSRGRGNAVRCVYAG